MLFKGVDEVRVEFLDEKGNWKSDWPEKKMDDKAHTRNLPAAIKLFIKTEKYGDLERVFQIGNVVHKQKANKMACSRIGRHDRYKISAWHSSDYCVVGASHWCIDLF
jgi:hypothetical protein